MPLRWIGALALAAGAVGGALATTEPTGTAGADRLLAAAFAVVVTVLATRAHPAAVLVAATVAAATGSPLAIALAALAAFLTLWRPAGWTAPLAGAALANALLRLAWPDRFGTTALIVVALTVLLAAAAWPRLPKRPALGLLGLAAGAAVAASAGVALTLASEADDLRTAINLSEAALTAARQGDTATAAANFERAGALLARTYDSLERWWVRPAFAVPVVAQHTRAVDRLTTVALDLTAAGRTAAVAADPSRLAVTNGAIDLAAVRDLRAPLTSLDGLLTNLPRRLASARSPWLLDRLTTEVDDLERRAAEHTDDIATAIAATEAAPWLLGDGVERRYFLAVANPAENRGGGGFVGNWGILTATDGRLELPRFGRINELYRDEPYDIDVNPEWNARYVDGWGVDRWPQNVLGSPHLPDNAEAIRQIAEQAGLGAIDGVIVLDPFAIAGFLELTGPLEVEGWGEPLTEANAAEILLHEQYLDADSRRIELLEDSARALFDRLTSDVLPSPAAIAASLGPIVDAGHLQLAAFDSASSDFLAQVGLERHLDPPTDDSIGLVTASAVASKLDWFLRRSVKYVVETEPITGALSATVEVSLENTAPADLVPNDYFGDPLATNRQLVSIYTAFPQATGFVNGEPVELGFGTERGHNIYEAIIMIPPGKSTKMLVKLAGRRPTPRDPRHLDLHQQSWAGSDDYRVVVDGMEQFTGPLVQSRHLTIRRPSPRHPSQPRDW